MNFNVVLNTFVGVWVKPISAIPILENSFTRGLFDDPINTNSGYTPDGFMIARTSNNIILDNVSIGYTRLQVTTANIKTLANTIKKIRDTLIKLNLTDFKFSTWSVTIEIETTDELKEASNQWLGNNIVKKGLNLNNDFKDSTFEVIDLYFAVNKADGKKYYFNLQPRVNKPESVYMKITQDKMEALDGMTIDETIENKFIEFTTDIKDNISKIFNL